MFVALDTTFTSLASVARPFIQETISESPPTLDVGTETLPRIRPFLAHSASLFTELQPGIESLRANADTIASALEVGAPVLSGLPGAEQRARAHGGGAATPQRRRVPRAPASTASARPWTSCSRRSPSSRRRRRSATTRRSALRNGQEHPVAGQRRRDLAAVHRLRAARRGRTTRAPRASAPANGGEPFPPRSSRSTATTSTTTRTRTPPSPGQTRSSARPATRAILTAQQVIGISSPPPRRDRQRPRQPGDSHGGPGMSRRPHSRGSEGQQLGLGPDPGRRSSRWAATSPTRRSSPGRARGTRCTRTSRTRRRLRATSPVRIAGVNVGEVTDVRRADDDLAEVTFTVDDEGQPIHEDAQLEIRPRLFLEGNFFLDLRPGSPSAPGAARRRRDRHRPRRPRRCSSTRC